MRNDNKVIDRLQSVRIQLDRIRYQLSIPQAKNFPGRTEASSFVTDGISVLNKHAVWADETVLAFGKEHRPGLFRPNEYWLLPGKEVADIEARIGTLAPELQSYINEQKLIASLQDWADSASIADPTPASDVVGIGMALLQLEFKDAGWRTLAAAVPFLPNAIVRRAGHQSNAAVRGIVQATNFTSELVVDAQAARRHLRRSVPGSGGQAHHIIPYESRNHEVLQRAARGGFNMNGANNGIRLDLTQHLGSHPRYNAAVSRRLDAILLANPRISDVDAARVLQEYADQLRAGLERSSGMLH